MIAHKDYETEALLEPNSFKAPIFFCAQDHKIELFCVSPECKFDSLYCSDNLCTVCGCQHKVCAFRKLQQLNKAVQDKLSLHSKTLRKLFDIQNQLVKRLLASRKQMIQKSKAWRNGVNCQTIDLIYSRNIIKGIDQQKMVFLFSHPRSQMLIFVE